MECSSYVSLPRFRNFYWVAGNPFSDKPVDQTHMVAGQEYPLEYKTHWIGLRENLQETMVFTIKYRAFL